LNFLFLIVQLKFNNKTDLIDVDQSQCMGGITAKGEEPLVTQASSVLCHWIMKYIHVFHPADQRYELRPVIRLAGRPSVVQICSSKFSRLFKSAPGRFSSANNMPK